MVLELNNLDNLYDCSQMPRCQGLITRISLSLNFYDNQNCHLIYDTHFPFITFYYSEMDSMCALGHERRIRISTLRIGAALVIPETVKKYWLYQLYRIKRIGDMVYYSNQI